MVIEGPTFGLSGHTEAISQRTPDGAIASVKTGKYMRQHTGVVGRAPAVSPKEKSGASGEIRTLKHLFLRQAAIPIRTRWHLVHRGGFEPPCPTWGNRVTAGPFRPDSR